MTPQFYHHAKIRIDTQRQLSPADVAKEFGLKADDVDSSIPVTPAVEPPGFFTVGIKSSAAHAIAAKHPGFIQISRHSYRKG